MKIVIVGPAHPYRGGIAAFNERLAQQYVAAGHQVEIITFTLQYPSFLFPGKTQYTTAPAPKNLSITREINAINPLNWWRVGRMICRKRADLVVVKFWLPFLAPCLGTIARLAVRNKVSKSVSILDNIIPHEKRIGDKLFASYFVRSIDGFISMSHSVENDLKALDHQNKPKRFSPHPLYDHFGESLSREEALKALNLDPSCRYMLFFGIIRDYKGLDLLLDAFAKSNLKERGVKLIVAGEFYSGESSYLEQAARLDLEQSIIWHTEFIDDHKVRYYFCGADIIVQPYKSATQSGVTQIAYHFGCPMLVTEVGGLAEIVPDGKVGYCTAVDSGAIATALEDFYDNDRHDAMVEGVKQEKKRYEWERMVEAVDSVLEEIALNKR